MSKLRGFIKKVPVLGQVARAAHAYTERSTFPGSERYWEALYARGGNSGEGSQGILAQFKAEVLNQFVIEHSINSVIEFGCGDGRQLSLMRFPRYIGLDVSPTALEMCRGRFENDATKRFIQITPELDLVPLKSDLALSLDVIYHLVENDIFEHYMTNLFGAAERHVIIYSNDTDETPFLEAPHVRFRQFSTWCAARHPDWQLVHRVPNRYPFRDDLNTGSRAEFFIYKRVRPAAKESQRSCEVPVACA